MSWMDSWSRPSKSQTTPPPYYLLPGGDKTPYCRLCGRVIGDRKTKTATASATPAKYCSSRCKTSRQDKELDRRIEDTFVALLNGQLPPGQGSIAEETSRVNNEATKKRKKGESRILVDCGDAEKAVFGVRDDPDKRFGRRKNRARRGVKDGDVWKSVDMDSDAEDHESEVKQPYISVPGARSTEKSYGITKDKAKGKSETVDENSHSRSQSDNDASDGGVPLPLKAPTTEESGIKIDPDIMARLSIRSGTRIRPPQELSEVNGGVGGEKGLKERVEETDEMLKKRREGQKKADQRELVRCAARRGVAFGFRVGEGEERRMCEAVMQGKVVESSFAKGDWGIRWRE